VWFGGGCPYFFSV